VLEQVGLSRVTTEYPDVDGSCWADLTECCVGTFGSEVQFLQFSDFCLASSNELNFCLNSLRFLGKLSPILLLHLTSQISYGFRTHCEDCNAASVSYADLCLRFIANSRLQYVTVQITDA